MRKSIEYNIALAFCIILIPLHITTVFRVVLLIVLCTRTDLCAETIAAVGALISRMFSAIQS